MRLLITSTCQFTHLRMQCFALACKSIRKPGLSVMDGSIAFMATSVDLTVQQDNVSRFDSDLAKTLACSIPSFFGGSSQLPRRSNIFATSCQRFTLWRALQQLEADGHLTLREVTQQGIPRLGLSLQRRS
jgi:hypothetical protein